MAVSRAKIVDRNFVDALGSMEPGATRSDLDSPVRPGFRLTGRQALHLFETMIASRHLDLTSRDLKTDGQSFYTIGSSGHETNAVVAAASRPTDPAFLHYRSGGFFLERASQMGGQTPVFDVLLGLVASSDEPIAGGRHKVFGSVELWIPPQTSTIASHLPKAVGAAFTLSRQQRVGLDSPVPPDSVVLCSFGDASSNHATACAAFNTASMVTHQNLPCPIVFVCEDNGLGISVRTPHGWVEDRFRADPWITYFGADGLDIVDAYEAAHDAVAHARETRKPAFLHLKLVRLLGHAGSDVEQLYRSTDEIVATESKDPLLSTAAMLIKGGWITPNQVRALYENTRQTTAALAREAVARPKLTSVEAIVEPLAPLRPDAVAAEAQTLAPPADRTAFHGRLPEEERPRHMAMLLNRALGDMLIKHPELCIFGEDVARKGGVYHVTAGLQEKAGVGRVFNTILDETSILGLALGSAQMGMLPIPEIQYLAYLHNAIDQLRGEACSLQFFSNAQYANPMVVRIAGLAYQKGFGGHFHNDNSVGSLREIPGLIMACPSNGEDAVGMMRTLIAAAKVDGRVSAFIEPIALYMTKDLHEAKDGLWSFRYPPASHSVPVGSARTWGDGTDLTIISYGNGHWMSLRVAERLRADGIDARCVDIRWLNPLPVDDMVREATATGRVLVVDECRQTGGMAEGIMTALVERCPEVKMRRVAGIDTFIPLGAAANLVLVGEHDIEHAARELVSQ
ncbi:MAG: thiamine pyrophosphate-dependent enzyme [Myxococcota bacterium]|nr:thiamine pyrophosphate-dependent enzyme [Myxococcota bacterium]